MPYVPPAPPSPTLDELKADKRSELTRARDLHIAKGYVYGDYVFPISDDVMPSMTVQYMSAQTAPASDYSWKDMDGIYREIGDAPTFIAFVEGALAYGESLYNHEKDLQAALNADSCDTPEEVTAITWDTETANS